jgi:hypothetical protein
MRLHVGHAGASNCPRPLAYLPFPPHLDLDLRGVPELALCSPPHPPYSVVNHTNSSVRGRPSPVSPAGTVLRSEPPTVHPRTAMAT